MIGIFFNYITNVLIFINYCYYIGEESKEGQKLLIPRTGFYSTTLKINTGVSKVDIINSKLDKNRTLLCFNDFAKNTSESQSPSLPIRRFEKGRAGRHYIVQIQTTVPC